MRKGIFVALLLFCSSVLSAEIPVIVDEGLKTYKEKGAEEFIKAWLAGSPLEKDQRLYSQSNAIKQMEDLYGKYENYDVVEVIEFTDRVRVIYLVMNYERSPVYASVTTYKTKDGWIITTFNLHTKMLEVLPERQFLR